MAILIDTQVLVWVATGSQRLSATAREILQDGEQTLLVSAVTAFEFADLNRRGRFGADLPLQPLLDRLEARVIACPPDVWRIADRLDPIHFDPIDRMLVAHAIHDDQTLLSADAKVRRYPVKAIW